MRLIRDCTNRNEWPLYLWGETGVGKTCAAAVAYALWQPSAMFISLTELCDVINAFRVSPIQIVQSRGRSVGVTQVGYWERLHKIDLVVLDEIGTREASAHRYDCLLRLLDVRTGKPTILTGNLDPDTRLSEVYDERIQSRIAAGVLAHVVGEDYRTEGLESRIKRI